MIIIICFCLWFCALNSYISLADRARPGSGARRGPRAAACRHDMLTSVREIESDLPRLCQRTTPPDSTCAGDVHAHTSVAWDSLHSCRPRQEVYPLLRRTCTLLYLYTRDMKNKFNRGEPCSSLDPFYVPLYRAVLSKRPAAPCYPSRRISIVLSDEK